MAPIEVLSLRRPDGGPSTTAPECRQAIDGGGEGVERPSFSAMMKERQFELDG